MLTKSPPTTYCNSLTHYSRLSTREVMVGDLGIGGKNPVRIQSMTTADTMNTMATVEESIRMIDAGCELVRITAPSINEAKNLLNIKNELLRRGYKIPLCADIHFTPNAAEAAARIVEKVRVNPGNYADKKKFEHIDYTDAGYDSELQRIRERFLPLVKICKEYGTAMRIGTNHGSLSDRILSRYGDTPLGMVESALEFLNICEDENYFNIVLSMKASNPQVMVQAYRLLIARMQETNTKKVLPPGKDLGWVFPLHLGVTEAGEGEDGRIKSAVGIGTLLEDGIGDTIRVSLTENPEFEIPVAKMLVERYSKREVVQKNIPEVGNLQFAVGNQNESSIHYNPFEYTRRQTDEVLNIGGKNVPRIIADFSGHEKIVPASLLSVGYHYAVTTDKWNLSDQACDYLYTGDQLLDFAIPGTLGIIVNHDAWKKAEGKERYYPLFSAEEFLNAEIKSPDLNFVTITISEIFNLQFSIFNQKNIVFIFETDNEHGMAEQRSMFIELCSLPFANGRGWPVIIKRNYQNISEEQLQLYASTDIGALLIDGFGDGAWINYSSDKKQKAKDKKQINSTLFGILQATRTRISKTEYISCPSCGRTLFNLQETTAKIRSRTDHLKGVKIGIMGCIVNGPGEMADADYGYVGTGVGKITLYKGKDVVQRNIDSENSVDALIQLIKQHGDWTDPVVRNNE